MNIVRRVVLWLAVSWHLWKVQLENDIAFEVFKRSGRDMRNHDKHTN
jgi:hypothetical protein